LLSFFFISLKKMQRIIIAFCILVVLCAAKDVTCKGTVSDVKNHRSYEFDLISLHHDEGTYVDTLWYRTDENTIYYVNFCGQTASACESSDTSVCIRVPDGEDYDYFNGGSTSTQKISIAEAKDQSPSSSVTVTYSDGDKCGSGKYKTKIYVNCQQTANPGYFYKIDESNECDVTLYMWAAAGCGKDVPYIEPSEEESGSNGGDVAAIVILVLLLVAVVAYFAIGAFYNYKFKEARSVPDLIIHREFWCSLPFLVKDGVLFIAHGFKKGDYVSV